MRARQAARIVTCPAMAAFSEPALQRMTLPLRNADTNGRRSGARLQAGAGLDGEVVGCAGPRHTNKREQQLHTVGVASGLSSSWALAMSWHACLQLKSVPHHMASSTRWAVVLWAHLAAHQLARASHIHHCGTRGKRCAQHPIHHACSA